MPEAALFAFLFDLQLTVRQKGQGDFAICPGFRPEDRYVVLDRRFARGVAHIRTGTRR